MAKSIFLMSSEPGTGKSIISLGLCGVLRDHFNKLGYFKPIATLNPVTHKDPYVTLLQQRFDLSDAAIQIGSTKPDSESEEDFWAEIVNAYRKLEATNDFVLVEGLDYSGDNPSSDFMLNLNIAKTLGCQIILVEKGQYNSCEQALRGLSFAINAILHEGLSILSLIANHVHSSQEETLRCALQEAFGDKIPCFSFIPEHQKLQRPTVQEVAQKINARVFYGEEQLQRQVSDYTIAAKMAGGFLASVKQKQDLLVITPGDREDLILSCLLADQSTYFPKFAGVLLTTNEEPISIVKEIIKGLPVSFPILITDKNTFDAATLLHNAQYYLFEASTQKIDLAIEHIRFSLNEKHLIEVLTQARSEYLTPPMFTYNLVEQAKKNKKHIVLPEGEDIRILQAAEELLRRDIVKLTILGNSTQIQALASDNHINLAGAQFINPCESSKLKDYATEYFKLRQHKNVNREFHLTNVMSSSIDPLIR